ncbi:mitochondrial enolase superfamily member 1 [Grus japonensis]|uniref:Mitochondrial enolase superfamily member 1 n=1 Tax=Grus japonensis TaxID=30415 RepID=A0ABC9WHK3_GRUJA
MKFNKVKGKVLHLGRNNPNHQYSPTADWLESSFAKKDVGDSGGKAADREPATHSRSTKRPNSILGCIRKSMTSRLRKVILPFYSPLMQMHLECCVQCWAPQYNKDMDLLEQAQGKATKMIKGLIKVYKHLMGGYKKEGTSLLSVMPSDRTRNNGHK